MKFVLYIITLLFLINTAQTQTVKSDIRASIPIIPGIMESAGEYIFVVKIRNTSDKTWRSGEMTASVNRTFRLHEKNRKLILKPGQSAELIYVLTAPYIPDIYKLDFKLQNNGIIILKTSKTIEIKRRL
jgi:hypothetical protein